MRYLEAKHAAKGEHKMQPGIRIDQQVPQQQAFTGTDALNKESEVADHTEVKVRADVYELAEELGIDLSMIKGTGRDGSITKGDVRAAYKKMERMDEV